MLFTGEYEHSIDAKQRVAIPAEIRSALEEEGQGSRFYLVPGERSLSVWPASTFQRMAAALETSLLPAEEMLAFEQLMFSQAARVEMDKTGRIRVPERMLAEAQLGPSVTILGVKDHLELHDPDRWKSQRRQKLASQSEIFLGARRALEERERRMDRHGP